MPCKKGGLGDYFFLSTSFISEIPVPVCQQAGSRKLRKVQSKKPKQMLRFLIYNVLNNRHKKRQATYITLLRPSTLAAFPPWGIQQELVV